MMLAKPKVGKRLGGDIEEHEHFLACPDCGQPLDLRDLEAVMHHMEDGHEPLPDADAFRLVEEPGTEAQVLKRLQPNRIN